MNGHCSTSLAVGPIRARPSGGLSGSSSLTASVGKRTGRFSMDTRPTTERIAMRCHRTMLKKRVSGLFASRNRSAMT